MNIVSTIYWHHFQPTCGRNQMVVSSAFLVKQISFHSNRLRLSGRGHWSYLTTEFTDGLFPDIEERPIWGVSRIGIQEDLQMNWLIKSWLIIRGLDTAVSIIAAKGVKVVSGHRLINPNTYGIFSSFNRGKWFLHWHGRGVAVCTLEFLIHGTL